MSRTFRVYEKKRGHRRTGSGWLAGAGETLFFGLFFLAGCGGLVAILATLVVPEWRVNNEFVETTCVVRAKELVEREDDSGLVYRPEVAIEYLVDGKPREATTYDICGAYSSDRDAEQAALDQFEVGGRYPCWYDPREPGIAVLVCGYSWWTWLLLSIPVSFILIGGGGFLYRAWHWGKSAERRAAPGMGPIKLGKGKSSGDGRNAYPTIPPPADMANSPGTTLRFRLPIHSSATFGLIVLAAVCVFWNSVVAALLLDVIAGFRSGAPNWIETIVAAPLTAVGLVSIFIFVRQFLIATGVGPTLLEISDHPLYPQRKYDLFLSQAGRLRLQSLELSLIGTEEASYRQGTDTRTESKCVYRQSLFRRENFEIHGGVPLEARCELEVPDGIMHSFKSENNALHWSLVVDGKVTGWPDYQRSFPVVIYPEDSESANA
ncbi:MAG: DUF3592 domain-containing protein [Pirellulales bacterium]|nr:DUF3592 domain-containing protein [Pirellulales bacterium]